MSEPRRSEPIVTYEVVFPQNTNHYGTLFGGQLMSWMDKVAYYAAARFSGTNAVTVSIESIDFSIPVRNGNLLALEARVIHTGRSSMVVKVDVHKTETPNSGERVLTNTGFFTFVALDDKGRPRQLPPLLIETGEEKALDLAGREIREKTLARRRQNSRTG